MSEAKHTPGPWGAIGNLVRSPMHQPEGLPRGVQIVECRDGYFLPHTEEAKANARLIAAAPELLSDLREAAATLRRYEALHRAKGTEDSTAKAEVNAALASRFEATIAKATQ